MAPGIEVVRIAANVCSRCRLHKQRCNRALPRCSRCASKLRHCDYSPFLSSGDNIPQNVTETEPLVISELHGFFDISSRGENELMQFVSACAKDINAASRNIAQLTSDILREGNVEISALIDRFSISVHRWFPVVDLDQLRDDARTLRDLSTEDASTPLLLFALLLFDSLQSYGLESSPGHKKLYTASKQLMAVLSSLSEEQNPRFVEIQALLGLYECSQGLVQQAQLTLSSTLIMVTLLESNSQGSEIPLKTKISLIVLDKIIMLSSADNSIPSLCNPKSPFIKSIESYIRRHFVGQSASFGASPTQQLYTMAQIALASGRVLHYIYCSNNGFELDESYTSVEKSMQALVTALMEAKDSHSIYLCDIFSLALCCLLMLHYSRVKQGGFIFDSWDNLRLRTSCRMIWDTARISFYAIKHLHASQVSFIGIFCQLRAVYSAIDISNAEISLKDMEDMLSTMEIYFFQRWIIGANFLRKIQTTINRPCATTAPSAH